MTAMAKARSSPKELSRQLDLPSADLSKILDVLAADPIVARAIVYGSRAKGTARQGSDIDMVVEGVGLNTRHLNSVATALDDLPIPYSIDLSIPDHIDNAALLDHIKRVGVVIYDRDG